MSIKDKLNILFHAARPKTLPASIGPVIIGLSVARYNEHTVDMLVALLTLLCALLLQISSNFINDYYDGLKGIDSNERLGPTRVTSTGKIAPSFMKRAFLISLSLSFCFGLYLMYKGGIVITSIGLLSILFSYLYTGGPFPLSYLALGELLAFIFYGPVAVGGTYYLQAGEFNLIALLMGSSLGFISSALMGINNLRDYDSDGKTKKITIALILGKKAMRFLIIFFIILSQAPQVYLIAVKSLPIYFIITLITPVLFIKTWKAILNEQISQTFNIYLANTGKYLFVSSLLMTILFTYESTIR